jgi:serine/threonine protein kinase
MQNEARAITKVCTKEHTHPNIVTVLNHGGIPNTPYYLFDMELCDLNLHDYIHRKAPPKPSESIPFFHKDAPALLKAKQIWNVMKQIACGVQFIHSQGVVHRDLKPANGIFPKMTAKCIVLYSRRSLTWKLADFGISMDGTTNTAVTTKYSRGSTCYRAPELVTDTKTAYTNKVDIWSMGCILFELAVGQKAFSDDIAVYRYGGSGEEFIVVLDETFDEISKSRITDTVVSSLQIKPSLRPSASDLLAEFIHDAQPTHVRQQYVQIHNGGGLSANVLELGGAESIPMNPLAKSGHFSRLDAVPDAKEDADAREKDREAASRQDAHNGRIHGPVAKLVDNINARDKNGMTELHFAAKRGDFNMIKALKKAGGDVSTTNNDGWTPMHYAVHYGHADAVKILREQQGPGLWGRLTGKK